MAHLGDLSKRTYEDAINSMKHWDVAHAATASGSPYKPEQMEESFDPANVDWEGLQEMYGDDPVLKALFEKMEEYDFRGQWVTIDPEYPPGSQYTWSDHSTVNTLKLNTTTSTNVPIDVTTHGSTNTEYLRGLSTVTGTFVGTFDDALVHRVSSPPTMKYSRKNARYSK